MKINLILLIVTGKLLSDEEIQELLFQSDIDLSDEDDILDEPRSSSECSGSSSDDDDEVEDDTPASHKVQGRGPIWKATECVLHFSYLF